MLYSQCIVSFYIPGGLCCSEICIQQTGHLHVLLKPLLSSNAWAVTSLISSCCFYYNYLFFPVSKHFSSKTSNTITIIFFLKVKYLANFLENYTEFLRKLNMSWLLQLSTEVQHNNSVLLNISECSLPVVTSVVRVPVWDPLLAFFYFIYWHLFDWRVYPTYNHIH